MNKISVLKLVLALSVVANVILIAGLLWFTMRPAMDNNCHSTETNNTYPTVSGYQNPQVTVQPQPESQPQYSEKSKQPTRPPPTIIHVDAKQCAGGATSNIMKKSTRSEKVNVFADLSIEEIKSVSKYLFGLKHLNLVHPHKAKLNSNYIIGIELHVPNKSDALAYLDGNGKPPIREAKATVLLPQEDPPVAAEYVVGPLPNPSQHYLNPRKRNPVPYRVRQFNNVEMVHAVRAMKRKVSHRLEKIIKESYGSGLFDCREDCIMFTSTAVSSKFSKERKLWVSTMYRVEFSTLHPVGFMFLLNVDGLDDSKWKIEKVWYAHRMFDSIEELLVKYEAGAIPKLRRQFPKPDKGEKYLAGSMNIRGKQFPEKPMPGPKQYEPMGHRYTITGHHVDYLQWSFDFRMSYAAGIQLYDIKYDGERIIYELSMQEITVLYSGANPTAGHSQLADSGFGFGNKGHGLFPGVDCPEHATFVPVTIYTESIGAKEYPNAICVFEHSNNVPLRRHKAHTHRSGFFYNGLVDNVLIVRTDFVMYNYDYIMDFIFHQNGAVEVTTYSTGYIISSVHYEGEKPFGFEVFREAVGSIHHHMFNFKVDMDIVGTGNRYETLDFVINNSTQSWYTGEDKLSQLSFKRSLKSTEKEAAYKFNFDTPKYHVFSNNKKMNTFQHPRGYRLLAKGFAKQILPEDFGALNTFTWSRYQIAVTKRKDEEEMSSSMHAIFDSADPTVSLQRYIDDDENIVDEDLVAWVTLGMHHIPHTEDVPNTPTTGTDMTILLLPYNYFDEDPSMRSRDAVRANGGRTSKDPMHIERYGIPYKFQCLPYQFDFEELSANKSQIFSSVG